MKQPTFLAEALILSSLIFMAFQGTPCTSVCLEGPPDGHCRGKFQRNPWSLSFLRTSPFRAPPEAHPTAHCRLEFCTWPCRLFGGAPLLCVGPSLPPVSRDESAVRVRPNLSRSRGLPAPPWEQRGGSTVSLRLREPTSPHRGEGVQHPWFTVGKGPTSPPDSGNSVYFSRPPSIPTLSRPPPPPPSGPSRSPSRVPASVGAPLGPPISRIRPPCHSGAPLQGTASTATLEVGPFSASPPLLAPASGGPRESPRGLASGTRDIILSARRREKGVSGAPSETMGAPWLKIGLQVEAVCVRVWSRYALMRILSPSTGPPGGPLGPQLPREALGFLHISGLRRRGMPLSPSALKALDLTQVCASPC